MCHFGERGNDCWFVNNSRGVRLNLGLAFPINCSEEVGMNSRYFSVALLCAGMGLPAVRLNSQPIDSILFSICGNTKRSKQAIFAR